MFNRISRHLKESFVNVYRNLAMTISSMTAVTITLILIGVFIIISTNITSISDSIKSSLSILVKIDHGTNEEDIVILQEKIASVQNVTNITYSSRHEELEKQINLYPQQADYYRRHRGENNRLYDVFLVEVNDATNLGMINEEISSLKGVKSAEQGGAGVETLVKTLNTTQQTGWIIVVILSLLALYLISNTIKTSIYAQREEISIMRNVGASNSFIRIPFVIGGMLIGALGSIIPIGIMVYGYTKLYSNTGGVLLSKMFVLQPIHPFMLQLSLLLLFIGMAVGFLGSFISVTRYLRWKR
ncbi:MAG: ABC transporter permease [Erysipelothrix sp.]|nr:ABC transporter permease [Erysipelothrix sp.]